SRRHRPPRRSRRGRRSPAIQGSTCDGRYRRLRNGAAIGGRDGTALTARSAAASSALAARGSGAPPLTASPDAASPLASEDARQPALVVLWVEGAIGAGKSTLIALLCAHLRADAGEASVYGADVRRAPAAARALLAKGVGAVVMTLGERGALLVAPGADAARVAMSGQWW
ncbi:MAG: hypothetical protein VX017_09835, partial [Pseudomonadota bacterium]|nr:hypothetical protein [Pseudomonadota bacterium]